VELDGVSTPLGSTDTDPCGPFCLLFLPLLARFEANMREPFCRELTKTMYNNLLLERIVERSMVGLLNIQCKFPSFSSKTVSLSVNSPLE
jgi:hypothetical protein